MRITNRILVALLAVALALGITACNGSTNGGGAQGGESAQGDAQGAEQQDGLNRVLAGKGLVTTFIGEDVTDAKATSDEEAQQVIESLIERMGGDSTTKLNLVGTINTEKGNTYHIFQQEVDGVMVYGASAKLIVNKDGKVIGLVSAILPNAEPLVSKDSIVSQEQAERVVADTLTAKGVRDPKIASEYTAQTIIPKPESDLRYLYAWVVYVKSPSSDAHDQAWLANYVSADGEYLYNIPVSEPNNPDAARGQAVDFNFDAYDQQEKEFTITENGKATKVTVPVLVDKKSGKVAWLGDAERKILCADYTQMNENDKLVSPFEEDGESFNDLDIAVYANIIRIWDFFKTAGWVGPNGRGAPTLLQMNYRLYGEPADNCAYEGEKNGWETFAFGRGRDYGKATDIMAHEFVHCLTFTTMTTNFYMNEPGAINEGMSDILGNIAEMALDGNDGAWIMGENAVEGGMRSMGDPTSRAQPEQRWGMFYAPEVTQGTSMNDTGGVHVNSSLLNIVSYKLDKAGMSVEDQGYFWMNVAMAMVPTTDFAQMAELLPWVMERLGFNQYVGALNQAIDEAGYTKLEQPSELPAGAGAITFTYPDMEANEKGLVHVLIVSDATAVEAWPAGRTALVRQVLPADDYFVAVIVGEDPATATGKVYTDKGWIDYDYANESVSNKGTLVHVEEGKTAELATDGLA